MTRTPLRTTTLATMIRHTTLMIMRRIFDVQWHKFSQLRNLRIEIIANFVRVLPQAYGKEVLSWRYDRGLS